MPNSGGGRLSAEQRDIGRLETHIQNYGQALGVITQLTRPLGAETECQGVCYLAKQQPADGMELRADAEVRFALSASPPVGGCD